MTIGKIHETKKTFRVRLRSPSKYKKFRRINLGEGIVGVVGIRKHKGPKGGMTELQTVIIPKKFDGHAAHEWMKKSKKM